MERRLIADYQAMIEDLTRQLSVETHGHAVALARLPEEIKGFGPVKMASIERYEKKMAVLLAAPANDEKRTTMPDQDAAKRKSI